MATRVIFGIGLKPQEANLAFELLKQIHTIIPEIPKLNPKRVFGGSFDVLTDEIVIEAEDDLFEITSRIRNVEGVEKVIPQFVA